MYRIGSGEVLYKIDTAYHSMANWISPSGKIFARSDSNKIDIYRFDCETKEMTLLLEFSEGMSLVDNLSLSDDEKILAFSNAKGTYVFDMASLKPKSTATTDDAQYIADLVWSPDGKWLIVGGSSIRILCGKSGKLLAGYPLPEGKENRFGVGAMALSPSGKLLAFTVAHSLHLARVSVEVESNNETGSAAAAVATAADFQVTQSVEFNNTYDFPFFEKKHIRIQWHVEKEFVVTFSVNLPQSDPHTQYCLQYLVDNDKLHLIRKIDDLSSSSYFTLGKGVYAVPVEGRFILTSSSLRVHRDYPFHFLGFGGTPSPCPPVAVGHHSPFPYASSLFMGYYDNSSIYSISTFSNRPTSSPVATTSIDFTKIVSHGNKRVILEEDKTKFYDGTVFMDYYVSQTYPTCAKFSPQSDRIVAIGDGKFVHLLSQLR